MNVDAIVNAANTSLQEGGGVCGAIFAAAGADKLQKACDALAPIKTGDAVVTKGFALPAKYIIHTAGPVYLDGKHDEENALRRCYINSLNAAKQHGCASIAFPLISSGIYGYPRDEAISVATGTIGEWLMENDMEVTLVVFDKAFFALTNELFGDIKTFIEKNYVDEQEAKHSRSRRLLEYTDTMIMDSEQSVLKEKSMRISDEKPVGAQKKMRKEFLPTAYPSVQAKKIDTQLDESFSDAILRLIDTKGKSDVEIYKRANLDRKLFSKIRTGRGYMPSKKTAVALAVAMELSLTETRELLERAGFALSRSVMFDVIIEYFITRKRYDIFEINNVLFEYDQPLLGG